MLYLKIFKLDASALGVGLIADNSVCYFSSKFYTDEARASSTVVYSTVEKPLVCVAHINKQNQRIL